MAKGRGLANIKTKPNAKVKMGFKALKGNLSRQRGVTSPGGLAAAIGRKKFGAKKYAKMAAAGRKKAR